MRRAAKPIAVASTFLLAVLETTSCERRTTRALSNVSSAPAAQEPSPPIIAYADASRVCLTPVVGDTLGTASCVATPSRPSAMVWRKRSELAVLLADGSAGVVSGASFSALPLPPATTWKVPKPDPAPFSLQEGTQTKLVVSEAGELWMGRCAWVTTVDVPACQVWVFARLDGGLKVQRDEPKAVAAAYGPASAPSDVRVVVEDTRIRCERGAEKSTFAAPTEEGASASVSISWPSASAPWYVAMIAYDHTEVVTHKAFLLKACTAAPGEELAGWAADEEALVWGPRGVFAHRRKDGWVVRIDGKVAGKLPGSAVAPVFQP